MIESICGNLWALWLVVAIACLIVELFSGGFFIICFAIGAAFAALAAAFGGIYIQLAAFVVFTAAAVFLVRPFALRYLHFNSKSRPSNADALLGRIGTVSQAIEQGGFGRVAIDGDDWKAQASDGETIEAGARVQVVGRESIILTVTKTH